MPTPPAAAIHADTFSIREVLARIPHGADDRSCDELTLTLPLPPSINRTMGTRLGSQHWLVRQWRREADAHLMVTRQNRKLRLLKGTLSIEIIWGLQNLADIDNRIKHLLDYLQLLNIVTNDNEIRSMHIDYGVAPEGCRVSLRQMDHEG